MDLVILDSDGGETRVRVERVAKGYRVEIDEQSYVIDHARGRGAQRSLIVEGRQQELCVVPESNGRYRVSSARSEELLEVRDPLDHLAKSSGAGAGVEGKASVTAYMPGRVVAILVAEGDEVTAGQGIVVLEAMKMENEIQTEVDGTVKKIFVEGGQSVEGGDTLFEIAGGAEGA